MSYLPSNNSLHTDVQKRLFALLLHAGEQSLDDTSGDEVPQWTTLLTR